MPLYVDVGNAQTRRTDPRRTRRRDGENWLRPPGNSRANYNDWPHAPANDIRDILARAKQAAVDYYRLAGKPLGITGEVGECEAARLLGLTLNPARVPGHDATDNAGRLYQIKSRAVPDPEPTKGQLLGSIKPDQEWDAVLLVLVNQELETQENWKADRYAVVKALAEPGSKARPSAVPCRFPHSDRSPLNHVWPQDR